jgi:hypothetical protein
MGDPMKTATGSQEVIAGGIERAIERLSLRVDDVIFVDARTIDPISLMQMTHPVYVKVGGRPIPTALARPGKVINCDDLLSFEVQRVGSRIVAVFPKDGQSVKECVYAMSAEELKKLLEGK